MSMYRSEVYVPVSRDSMTFDQRQKTLWQDMESRMSKRHTEWERELEDMRKGFFRLRPQESSRDQGSTERLDDNRSLIVQSTDGTPGFKVNFDLSQFKAEEISVSTKEHILFVHAKHQEQHGSSTVTREFSKKVEIPANVDQEKLTSRLSADGILTVEAKLPSPTYSSAITTTNQSNLHSQQPMGAGTNSALMQTSQTYSGGPIVTAPDGTRKLYLEFDVQNFAPEEIVVKTENRRIKVHGRHEEKSAGRTSYREYNKEYDIPDTVDAMQVTSYVSENSKLVVEAPLKAQFQQQIAQTMKPKRHIPVHHT